MLLPQLDMAVYRSLISDIQHLSNNVIYSNFKVTSTHAKNTLSNMPLPETDVTSQIVKILDPQNKSKHDLWPVTHICFSSSHG